MTQETEEAPLELALVSCQTCDLAFIGSDRRQTCPVCGGEAAGPYFQWTLEGDGLRLRDGAAPAAAGATPPAPGAEPPAEEAEAAPAEAEAAITAAEGGYAAIGFSAAAGAFLYGGAQTEEELHEQLMELGAEREAATTAVGRLVAVRELIAELAAAGVEAEVAVEAVSSPEETAEAVSSPEAQAEEPAEPAAAAAAAEPADLEAPEEPAP